jgi:hypothetical protein
LSEEGDLSNLECEIRQLRRKLKLLKKRGTRKRPNKLDVKPFKGDAKDLRRFVYDVESKLD